MSAIMQCGAPGCWTKSDILPMRDGRRPSWWLCAKHDPAPYRVICYDDSPMPEPRRTTMKKWQLTNHIDPELTIYEMGTVEDLHPVVLALRGARDLVVILDAEMTLVAISPRETAAAIAEVLNIVATSEGLQWEES